MNLKVSRTKVSYKDVALCFLYNICQHGVRISNQIYMKSFQNLDLTGQIFCVGRKMNHVFEGI